MHDVIVVGTGAAGTCAALELAERGVRALVLDVGHRPDNGAARVSGNFYEHKTRADTFELTIGGELQGLANHLGRPRVPVKLTVPSAHYVTYDADRIAPVDAHDFSAIQSFAAGGLANAWGAGLYRFTDRDLEGIPLCAHDLDPYFDRLTREIGICGEEDDLTPFFGSTDDLLPSLRLSRNMRHLLEAYRRKRRGLPRGFHLGRPRIAVLSRPHRGRPAFEFHSLEFFQESEAVYTPRRTLDDLVARDAIEYRPGVVVETFEEGDEGVEVCGRDAATGEPARFSGRKLVLAAGAINTGRIVLASFGDLDARLQLLENPAIQIPFVILSSLGEGIERDAFGLVSLNLVWESETFAALCQGSIMEITAPTRAEFFAGLPYAAHSNLALLRRLLPAMFVMQFYLPGSCQEPARMSLRDDGGLRIDGHPNAVGLAQAAPLFRFFRRLGAWSHPALVVRVPTGHAVHYAGTLPMRQQPGRYECDPTGALAGTRHVYIADSAAFGALPAKNMSFGMMAYAMRVAANARNRIGGSA